MKFRKSLLLFFCVSSVLAAQEALSVPPSSLFSTVISEARVRRNPGFQFNTGLSFSIPAFSPQDTPNYQTIVLQPMFNWKAFTVMLDVELSFYFTLGETPTFGFMEENWIPRDLQSGLEWYLPMLFLQYGRSHEEIYVRYGPLNEITMGNGSLVKNYSNTIASITPQAAGFFLKMDGTEFDFPYLGGEALFGDIAHLDVFAARIFARPLGLLASPWSQIEIGVFTAIDRDSATDSSSASITSLSSSEYAMVLGADISIPFLSHETHALEFTSDFFWQSRNAEINDGVFAVSGGFQFFLFRSIIIEGNIQYLQPGIVWERFNRNTSLYGSTLSITISENYLGADVRFGLSFLDGGILLELQAQGPFLNIAAHEGFTVGGQLTLRETDKLKLAGFHTSIYYHKTRIKHLSDFTHFGNTILGGKIGVTFSTISIEIIAELHPIPEITTNNPFEIALGVQGVISF